MSRQPFPLRSFTTGAAFTLLLATTVPAQTFQRTLGTSGDDRSEWIAPCADGGWVVCGTLAGSDAWIVKYTSAGAVQWETAVPAPLGFAGRIFQAGTSYRLSGYSSGVPPYGTYLAELDASGNLGTVWLMHGDPVPAALGGNTAIDFAIGGGTILASRKSLTSTFADQACMLIRNDLSSALWTRYYRDDRYGLNGVSSFSDVATAQTRYYAVGSTKASAVLSGTTDSLVVSLDYNGDAQWARTYSIANHHDEAFGIDLAQNGDLLITGFTKSIGEGGGSYVMRLDSAGTLLWYRTYTLFFSTDSIEEVSAGNILLGGFSSADPAMMLLDGGGNVIWAWRYGLAGSGIGGSALQANDGGYVLSASTDGYGAGNFDQFLIKTDAAGQSGCHQQALVPAQGTLVPVIQDIPFPYLPDLGDTLASPSASHPASLRFEECAQGPFVMPYCFGANTGIPCPCANDPAPNSGTGCINSIASGGLLGASGTPSVFADTFVLQASGMPNTVALFAQTTSQQNSGLGVQFGDGVLCVAGSLVRLGVKFVVGGSAQYPGTGDLLVSVKGLLPPGGGTRNYQVYYRDPPVYCTTATFNLTNGLQVLWSP